LIISSDMMQDQDAGHRVEGVVGERKVLGIGDLKARGDALLARFGSRSLDHLWAGINAIGRAARRHPLGEKSGQTARATTDVENMITSSNLQIVSEHRPKSAAAAAQQPSGHVIEPCPVNEPVTVVVMATAGVGHW
jgi:hypothetical protein